MRNIFIVGVRRSGTTIFWRTFRKDARLLCFDEPFNPQLGHLSAGNAKGTWDEFMDLREHHPDHFMRLFAPISPGEESAHGLTEPQLTYLRWLLDRERPVLCDFVRCSFKLNGLYRIDPRAVVVHLHRDPAAFASSHLLPSGGRWRRRLLNSTWRRASFWWRRGDFNRWRLEEVTGRNAASTFGRRVSDHAMSPERVFAMPAVGRLLVYWKLAYEETESMGAELFGDRFISIQFEDFCSSPRTVVERIYQTAEATILDTDYEHVRPANPPFSPEDPRWERLYAELGINRRREERS